MGAVSAWGGLRVWLRGWREGDRPGLGCDLGLSLSGSWGLGQFRTAGGSLDWVHRSPRPPSMPAKAAQAAPQPDCLETREELKVPGVCVEKQAPWHDADGVFSSPATARAPPPPRACPARAWHCPPKILALPRYFQRSL